MAYNDPVTDEERTRIVDLLHEHGGNRSKVARISGRSKTAVHHIAAAEGIESVNGHLTKNATEVSNALRNMDRMSIIIAGLEKGEELLGGVREARDYKDVMTGIAIGIDKHRLETGDVTDRTESRRTKGLSDFFKEVEEGANARWEASLGANTD